MPTNSKRECLLRGLELEHTYNNADSGISWQEFRKRYEATLSGSAINNWPPVAAHFERLCFPAVLQDITDDMLSRFIVGLGADGFQTVTIRGRLTCIRAALKWGFDAGLIDAARFNVERASPDSPWRWRKGRQWANVDFPGQTDPRAPGPSWSEFRKRYDTEAAATFSPLKRALWTLVVDSFEAICDPRRLSQVSARTLERFQAQLGNEGIDFDTAFACVNQIRRAIYWANYNGMLPAIRFRLAATGRDLQ